MGTSARTLASLIDSTSFTPRVAGRGQRVQVQQGHRLPGRHDELVTRRERVVPRLPFELRRELRVLRREHLHRAARPVRRRDPREVLVPLVRVRDDVGGVDAEVEVRLELHVERLVLLPRVLEDVDVPDVPLLLVELHAPA